MQPTDPYAIAIVHAVYIGFTGFVIYCDNLIRKKNSTGNVNVVVNRGDPSMTALHTVYGATIASFLVLLGNTSCLDGHKVIVIVIDFLFATYLFYFSYWFRNAVFFPIKNVVQKD